MERIHELEKKMQEEFIIELKKELEEAEKHVPDSRLSQAYWDGKKATLRWVINNAGV